MPSFDNDSHLLLVKTVMVMRVEIHTTFLTSTSNFMQRAQGAFERNESLSLLVMVSVSYSVCTPAAC